VKKLIPLLLLLCGTHCFAQKQLSFLVKEKKSQELLMDATVSVPSINQTKTTDSSGKVMFQNVPATTIVFTVSFVGYVSVTDSIDITQLTDATRIVLLERNEAEEEEEEIIITSTRSTRTIYNIPTRVEFIAGEELDEKANMKPGDIRMVLNESTGVMTQQTSATSANASIRIQGLDGRYTQILRDGMPLYAGFSGGLGLLQTPPLDLKQFEIIKGSYSTLYGGGAIAGLVNLISKTPAEERELRFLIDATTAGGLNTSTFYGQRFNKFGITVFASRNSNAAFDPADIGLTAVPKFERYTINPKLFYYFSEKTTLSAGVNYTTEQRTGGDMRYIKGDNPTGFFERNNSNRLSTQLDFEHRFGKCSHITVKNSFNSFQRKIALQGYVFDGTQLASFTEASYAYHGEKMEWVTGINIITDEFKEQQPPFIALRNYNQFTTGVFVQNTWKMSEKVHLESGVRYDFVKDYGTVPLPRVSLLVKYSSKLSSRFGGGLGYKAPTIFTEETERLQYKAVAPISSNLNTLEKSYGFNADINYRTKLLDDAVDFSFNHLFFYTRINQPLLLLQSPSQYNLSNVDGYFDSRGMETNLKLGYHDFKLFLGYTYTETFLHRASSKTENFLTPRHRINSVLMYEVEEKWKLGLEAYHFSKQQLSDGATGKPYWIFGFMAEKLWEKFSIYINFENFSDTRQTRFDTIYTGPISNPVFRDIYAPLDGFLVNGGLKLRL
jgi:outer membrane receptor protein involved in Fe transport